MVVNNVFSISQQKGENMPRRSEGSQAAFIRDFFANQPDATDDQIIEAGKEAKIKISKYAIGYVRYSRPKLGQSTETDVESSPVQNGSAKDNPLIILIQSREWKSLQKEVKAVRRFCDQHGGIERVKPMLESVNKYDQIAQLVVS